MENIRREAQEKVQECPGKMPGKKVKCKKIPKKFEEKVWENPQKKARKRGWIPSRPGFGKRDEGKKRKESEKSNYDKD